MSKSSLSKALRLVPKQLTVMLLPLLLAAGCGTIMTRGGSPTFGAYPYQAVANDFVYWLPMSFNQPGHPIAESVDLATVILLVPLDFAIDTVLLPVDLAYSLAGKKKGNGGPSMGTGP